VDVPAVAAVLPVRVNVQTTAPAEFTAGALHVAVKPLGSPAATEIVDPVAPAGITTPPTGVAVTVTVADESDGTDTVVGDAEISTAGAYCTCNATCLVAVNPSPLAVIVTVAAPTVAEDEAVSVSVDAPLSAFSVTELLLHEAVTPAGNPLTLRVTAPLYVALPANETTSVNVEP
jgi:hypothetical protein